MLRFLRLSLSDSIEAMPLMHVRHSPSAAFHLHSHNLTYSQLTNSHAFKISILLILALLMSVAERLERLFPPSSRNEPSKPRPLSACTPSLFSDTSSTSSSISRAQTPALPAVESNEPNARWSAALSSHRPWPQCQGNCPHPPCRDLTCGLKGSHIARSRDSPHKSFTSLIAASTAASVASKSEDRLKPPPVPLTPFAHLEHRGYGTSANSTLDVIDFRDLPIQQVARHPSPKTAPDEESQTAHCGFTDVEAELSAITRRISPRLSEPSEASTIRITNSPAATGEMTHNIHRPTPKRYDVKKQRSEEDSDIFAPIHYGSTAVATESIDSAALSDMVTDVTGVSILIN